MTLGTLTETERKDIARRHLDAAESWLRRIIDRTLGAAVGPCYFDLDPSCTCASIAKEIREHAHSRHKKEPDRFPRVIDATEFGHAVRIVLHPYLYKEYFRPFLKGAFPDGNNEARTFLTRLESIRNKLSHGGTCSDRDLERAVCYSNDLIESIKDQFREQGVAEEFNVPRFIRAVDNLGNEFHFAPREQGQHVDVTRGGKGTLTVGDVLSIEVEVDPSFQGYEIKWITFNGDKGVGPFQLKVGMKHVGTQMIVRFEVSSKESWHRLHGGVDDMLDLHYKVLPPRQ